MERVSINLAYVRRIPFSRQWLTDRRRSYYSRVVIASTYMMSMHTTNLVLLPTLRVVVLFSVHDEEYDASSVAASVLPDPCL